MPPENTRVEQSRFRPALKPLLILLSIAIVLLLVGNLVFQSLRDAVKDNQKGHVTAIGRLKAKQIKDWLDDRHSDIKTLSDDSYFARDVEQWLRSGRVDDKQRARINQRMDAFIESHNYHSIGIYDGEGRFVLRAGNEIEHEEDMTE